MTINIDLKYIYLLLYDMIIFCIYYIKKKPSNTFNT